MSVKQSRTHYRDARRVLETAAAKGGLRVEFPTEGKAIGFRNRCYSYRKLLMEQSPDPHPSTPFDDIMITRDEKVLIFQLREVQASVYDLDGNPVDLADLDDRDDIIDTRMPEFDIVEDWDEE